MQQSDFEFLRDFMKRESGITLYEDKIYLIKARLEPVLKKANIRSIEELVTRLRWQPKKDLIGMVVDVMTTNETFFYRDNAPFDALRNDVLPELIKMRAAKKSLDIWCAACSSGQEPYSIAMLIREYFPVLNDWKINILATDVSSEIVDKARKGYYTQFEMHRGLPKKLLKYFEQESRGWTIKEEIRNMITFQQGNLVATWPATTPPMDIIFMRNVLIYFENDVKSEILRKTERVLKRDGFLFLGQSETVSQLKTSFEPHQVSNASCFRLQAIGKKAIAY
ncbi:MAG: protein-glutamate O-methyltransferase CheR [Rhodothermales bacterium]